MNLKGRIKCHEKKHSNVLLAERLSLAIRVFRTRAQLTNEGHIYIISRHSNYIVRNVEATQNEVVA